MNSRMIFRKYSTALDFGCIRILKLNISCQDGTQLVNEQNCKYVDDTEMLGRTI
jgi:hypothetical protein